MSMIGPSHGGSAGWVVGGACVVAGAGAVVGRVDDAITGRVVAARGFAAHPAPPAHTAAATPAAVRMNSRRVGPFMFPFSGAARYSAPRPPDLQTHDPTRR